MTKRVAAFCAALLSSFAVFLVVALWGATFQLDGNTSRALLPGVTAPINVRISNPHFYPITVSDLTVHIDKITPAHKGETCAASNFTLRQPAKFIVLDNSYLGMVRQWQQLFWNRRYSGVEQMPVDYCAIAKA